MTTVDRERSAEPRSADRSSSTDRRQASDSDVPHDAVINSNRQLLDVVGLVALNHLTGAFNLVAGLDPEPENPS